MKNCIIVRYISRPALDKQRLGELIDLIGSITLSGNGAGNGKGRDILGFVFEYFLGQFADAEGKKGGQFYTPQSIVKLLVEMLAPEAEKRVYDGCCVWMVENLKTTKFNDGTAIPLLKDITPWNNISSPGYCWYNNKSAYKNNFGALYNWFAVDTGKLCPKGWHVPTDAEWTILTDFLGGENVAGGKMKETGNANWLSPNTGATNESGFFAIPGNSHSNKEIMQDFGQYCYWWSSTQYVSGAWKYGWSRILRYNYNNILRYRMDWSNGFSVRCVRD